MLDAVLRFFPAHTHPLTLVSDPDAILADPELHEALGERAFRLIERTDPIELRVEVEHARPFTAATPVIIVTREHVNTLPYDLWQQGHHVQLTLREMFPRLDPAIVRMLSPRQRRRLSDVQPVQKSGATLLSRRETIAYLMECVFGLSLAKPITPAELINWLSDFHASGEPLPVPLATDVLAHLRRQPKLSAWPLDSLLSDAAAYQRFVQDGWATYLRQQSADPGRTAETAAAYSVDVPLPFISDTALQDAVPRLVRTGIIHPPSIPDESALPRWALIGVAGRTMEEHLRSYDDTLHDLVTHLPSARTWDDWCGLALLWAQLSLTHDDLHLQFTTAQRSQFERAQADLDERFLDWLMRSYAPLTGQALPLPHHLFHVPGWLAAQHSQKSTTRTALLIFDGMSLADWLLVRETWQARHPDWLLDQRLVLAEAPSITAISRLALVSGTRPNAMSDDQLKNQYEEQRWREFWQQRGLPADAAIYAHLPARADAQYPNEISSYRTQAICLVTTIVDDMVHGATQGAASVRASLEVWLRQSDPAQPGAAWMEGLIQQMLNDGYSVTITSDHGHVDAVGIGSINEGVLVSTRSKRARLYSSPDLAQQAHSRLPATILLDDRWLPPGGVYPLVSMDRSAFAPRGERVVSHGGLSIDEMLVPLIALSKK